MMKKDRFPYGFTLIELLVVVAIIAILAAIAVVNLSEATNRALRASCSSSLHTLGIALVSYRVDNNRYPPADGVAGTEPSPNKTELGNGPAANGSWDGASRLLITYHFLSSDIALFCPAYKKRFPDRIQNFRYAYNSSATDTGGESGGSDNIQTKSGKVWLARCLWVPAEYSFTPESNIAFPHPWGDEMEMENVLYGDGRVELSNGKLDFEAAFELE